MTIAELEHGQPADQTYQHLVAGRYRLRERIGSGRIGEIYAADDEGRSDLGIEQHVAIQLLPDRVTKDQALFSKLRSGYNVLRGSTHPNIVPFLDFDHDGKFGYLVMDLLEGASLRLILDDAATLPLDEVIPIVRAVGDALQFLHTHSMVHGRLTAGNVFVIENLEVRLLDIVPVDATATILRGVDSGDTFSRCDIPDDIYGLACLAYEMLVGKHPFNFHALAEARQRGLEPSRTDSVPEKQWNALCHALSFDREQQTPAVADFLREFGIKGTERLRSSQDAMTQHDFTPSPAGNEMPPTSLSVLSSSSASTAAQVLTENPPDPFSGREGARAVANAKGRLAWWIPSAILMTILVALGGWNFYGQPRDDVVTLIDYVVSNFDGKSPASGDGDLPIDASDHAPAASMDAGTANILSATTTEAVEARAETTDGSLVAGDSASSALAAGATDVAAMEPADEQLADSTTDASRSNDDTAPDAIASRPDIDGTSNSEPEGTRIPSVISVSEGEGSVRITTRIPANTAGQLFWWTRDYTAIAENDYIPVEQAVKRLASGEEVETLHIPLINDSLPELQETFYVYLGRQNAQLERPEPILRIRIQINDDD